MLQVKSILIVCTRSLANITRCHGLLSYSTQMQRRPFKYGCMDQKRKLGSISYPFREKEGLKGRIYGEQTAQFTSVVSQYKGREAGGNSKYKWLALGCATKEEERCVAGVRG